VSFESNEELASIQVSVTGPESTTLRESDFSKTESVGDTYTYTGTYQASSDGEFTATLEEAADESENDGSSDQSANVSVQTSSSTNMFEDRFNDEDFDTDVWSVTRIDDETYTERDDMLHIESPKTYNDPGLVLTKQTFDSEGIVQVEAEHRITSEDWWDGRIFRLDFGEAGALELNEHLWEDNDRLIVGSGEKEKLASATDSSDFLKYKMTIDFDEGSVTEIQRGDETFDIDYDISDLVGNEYSFGFKMGKGVTRDYRYIKIF
jgi:hypothetical protein